MSKASPVEPSFQRFVQDFPNMDLDFPKRYPRQTEEKAAKMSEASAYGGEPDTEEFEGYEESPAKALRRQARNLGDAAMDYAANRLQRDKPLEVSLPGLSKPLDPLGLRHLGELLDAYQFAFQKSMTGKVFLTSPGIVTVVNKTFVQNLGFHAQSQLVGKHISEFIPVLSEKRKEGDSSIDIDKWFQEPCPVRFGELEGEVSAEVICNDFNRPQSIPDTRKVYMTLRPYEHDPRIQQGVDCTTPATVYAFIEVLFVDDFGFHSGTEFVSPA